MRSHADKDLIADTYTPRAAQYAAVIDPSLIPLVETMIRIADISARSCVLDLATGTGAIARAAADLGAAVVGADFSPGMVAVARRRSHKRIGLVVADASALPINNDTFDVVTCGLALSHLADVPTSLRGVRRVLKRGGNFVASSWGTAALNPAFSTILEVLKRHTPGAIHPFAQLLDEGTWASTESGCMVLQRAGFAPVRATANRLTGTYGSPQAAFDWVFAWPSYGKTLAGLDAGAQEAVRTEAIAAIAKAGDLSWEYTYNCFVAVKPRSSA